MAPSGLAGGVHRPSWFSNRIEAVVAPDAGSLISQASTDAEQSTSGFDPPAAAAERSTVDASPMSQPPAGPGARNTPAVNPPAMVCSRYQLAKSSERQSSHRWVGVPVTAPVSYRLAATRNPPFSSIANG